MGLMADIAPAATYYWDNNGATAGFGTAAGTWAVPTAGDATQGWSTSSTGELLPGNITTAGANGTTDALNFGTATDGLAAGTITVSGTVSSGNITFGAAAGALVLSGGAINLNGNIVNNSGTTQTFGSAINLGAGQRDIVGSSGARTVFDGGINFGTGRLFPNTTAHTVVLNAAGSGGGASISSFAVTGPSTMRTNVGSAVIELGHGAALGAGFIQINNGDATLLANKALTGSDAVGNTFLLGNSSLVIGGDQDLELSGTSTFFTAPASTAGGAILVAGGNRTLYVTNIAKTTVSGKVSLSDAAATGRTLTVNVAATAGTLTISGQIVNYLDTTNAGTAGGLTKANSGTLILSGSNVYTGTTTVGSNALDGGNLVIGNGTGGSIGNSPVSVIRGTLTGNLTSGYNVGGDGTPLTTIGNGTPTSGAADATITGGDGTANSIGRLATSGGLTLNSDAIFVFDLNGTTGTSDVVEVDGETTINAAAQFTFNYIGTGAGLSLNQTFTAIGGAGGITGTFANLAEGQVFTFGDYQFTANNYTTADNLVFTVTAVPEPASLAIVSMVGSALLLRRRVRKKR